MADVYDLIIIGGGPGGVAAGVYAARKKMKTLLITDSFGGQSNVSGGIENWIGTKLIAGYDFAKSLEDHLRVQKEIEIIDDDLVTGITSSDSEAAKSPLGAGFTISTRNGKKFESRFVLLASGSNRKKLGVPGEKEFDGKGVVYCSTCDAPMFDGKTVAVVGGGNSALESVLDLDPYASKIYLIVRSEILKGDQVSIDKIGANGKVEILWNTVVEEITGSDFVTGIKLKDSKTGAAKELPLDGVFVEIGLIPNSEFVKDIVELDARGDVKVDPRTQMTSHAGIWAVGDVTDGPYRQNNISAGDAVKAILNIHDHFKRS